MTEEETTSLARHLALEDRVETLEKTVGRLAHQLELTKEQVKTLSYVAEMRWNWAGGNQQPFVPKHWRMADSPLRVVDPEE